MDDQTDKLTANGHATCPKVQFPAEIKELVLITDLHTVRSYFL
jgi:hypothetical protein